MPRELERKAIGKASFAVEATTISASQRIQIRKLLQKAKVKAVSGQELIGVAEFIATMGELARQAGGEPPRPAPPDIEHLEDIRLTTGNEQLLAVYNLRERLDRELEDWTALGQQISSRWPVWAQLQQLLDHAEDLKEAEVLQAQARKIEEQRMLLADPDPVKPMISNLTQLLREALNELNTRYGASHEAGMERLRNDANWQQLEPEQRHELLAEQKLTDADRPSVNVQSTGDLLKTLSGTSLSNFSDRVAAMPARFDHVLQGAAELMEPEVQFVGIPRRILKTESEIDEWITELRALLIAAIKKSPVGIK